MKSTELTPVSVSGRDRCRRPARTSMMYCEKVSAKPVIGRAMIQARVRSQNGSPDVTMSVITPRGMNA